MSGGLGRQKGVEMLFPASVAPRQHSESPVLCRPGLCSTPLCPQLERGQHVLIDKRDGTFQQQHVHATAFCLTAEPKSDGKCAQKKPGYL